MNTLLRHGFQFLHERQTGAAQSEQQPSDLHKFLVRAVNVGRRRGHGRRGQCICGRHSLKAAFDPVTNKRLTCEWAASHG